jgi:hypothetical protein
MIPKKTKRIRPPPKMTNDDKRQAKKQPRRHSKNKGFIESLFGTCCAQNHDLNKRELKYYNKFVNSMIQEYDRENQDHEENLK